MHCGSKQGVGVTRKVKAADLRKTLRVLGVQLRCIAWYVSPAMLFYFEAVLVMALWPIKAPTFHKMEGQGYKR